MKILMLMIFGLCVISNNIFVSSLEFSNSNEQIHGRKETNVSPNNADTRVKRDVRMNLQNDKTEAQQESDTTEYSAAANACERYAREISNWTIDDGGGSPNEFPWMAGLGYINSRNHQIEFECNGVIISEYFILTAAQCVQVSRAPVVVLLGSSSLSAGAARDYPIKETIQHPYYTIAWKRNDIALIRLAIRIHFTNSIRPACLETDTHDKDPTKVLTAIGWGREEKQTDELLKVNLQTMPLEQCNKTYLAYNKQRNRREYRNGISRSQFCAHNPNSPGSSGSILNGGSVQFTPPNASLPNLVGLISIRAVGLPEVLTKVAYYMPWIEANVWPFDRRKIDVEPRDTSNINLGSGTMSLLSATQNGYDETVSSLIFNGANVNEISDGETTLLHVAAAAGHEKIARLLIHNGVDFTAKNKNGKTASDIATEKCFTELAPVFRVNVAQKACDIYSNLPVVTPRILFGEDVDEDEFPWMAALGYLDLSLRVSFRCGGTLISEKFVLTAAHCCKSQSRPVAVRLGQVYLNNPENTYVENHLIREITLHPDYSLERKTSDIALIELVSPVFFSQTLRPACLRTYLNDENPNKNLTITGWGIVSAKYGNTSNVLLKATLKTVPLSECNTTYYNHALSRNWAAFRSGLDRSYYCAADPNEMSDTCEGDSGGPLQTIRQHLDLSTVVGVVATGVKCGNNFPGIYTRVAHFIDWIESHVWPNGEIATPMINQAVLYD